MLLKFILSLLLIGSMHARAAEFHELREINFVPNFGYSSFSGFVFGGKLSLTLPVTSKLQWETGGMIMTKSKRSGAGRTAEGIFTGPIYNFGSDTKRAFYMGTGIGMSNVFPFGVKDHPEQKVTYGFVKLGKRFVLNEAETFSYKPQISFSSAGGNRTNAFSFEILQFAWSF